MNFWEELKLSMIGARNPSLANQTEKGIEKDLKEEKELEELREKELERANNPADKNIVIPADYLRYSKPGILDGNIVDDYIRKTYGTGIPYKDNLMPGTNVVINPITGLASGLARTTSGNDIIEYRLSSYYPGDKRSYGSYFFGPLMHRTNYRYKLIQVPEFDANGILSVNNVISPDTNNTPVVPEYKPQHEVLLEPAKESANNRRTAYNQARGITTAEAYKRQKALRDAGYDITYDGYYGDASAAAWEDYMQTKAANMTPKMETPSLAVAPSVTKPVTTPKVVDPNFPEANRQRFLDEQAAKIATVKMPSQFSNVDIMGAIKAEEARKKAELEALMQKQGAGSELLNTDPHNIQGGYVVPVEPLYDMSKMDTHNKFGLKFYKGGMIPKHQNASGEELKEKNKSGIYYIADEKKNGEDVNLDELLEGYGDNHLYVGRNITYKPSGNDTIYYDLNGAANSFDAPEYKRIFENNLKKSITVPVTQSVIDNKDYVLQNFDENYYNDWLKAHNYLQYMLDTSRINLRYGLSKNNVILKQEGGLVKEKPKMISISGPNYNETIVEGTDSTGTNKYQFREVEQQGDTTKVLYMRDPKTGQVIAVPADSRFNKDFEWMVRNSEPINEFKKGGSLKKCSCGCKTLLKRGKGGKVMESRNCK